MSLISTYTFNTTRTNIENNKPILRLNESKLLFVARRNPVAARAVNSDILEMLLIVEL